MLTGIMKKIDSQEEELEKVKEKLLSFAEFPEQDFNQLAKVLHKTHFGKGKVIFREGQVCKYFYIILKGCFRSLGLKDRREVNVNFYFEDNIVCDFASFRDETPSEFYIIAIEDCIAYGSSKTEALPVFEKTPSLHMFLFRFFQKLYIKEEEHSNSFKMLEPEDRYKYLLENSPEYLQRIPITHLASYLGISRETLSRIRRKIS